MRRLSIQRSVKPRPNQFEKGRFVAAIASGATVHPMAARGYADRTVYGHLATRAAYLERVWEPVGRIEPLALVRPGGDRSNVVPAYAAAGFTIHAAPGAQGTKDSRSGGVSGRKDPWSHPGRARTSRSTASGTDETAADGGSPRSRSGSGTASPTRALDASMPSSWNGPAHGTALAALTSRSSVLRSKPGPT